MLQAVEASRDLLVKSEPLLTLFLHINRLWKPLKLYKLWFEMISTGYQR